MKSIVASLAILIAIPGLATAGEVYGKVTSNGAPVADASIGAACGGKKYAAVPTDKTGTYHIVLAETGKCTLTVTVKGQSADVSVLSYDDAAQADLILETKDGKLTARRK
jgi:hypothetical protein